MTLDGNSSFDPSANSALHPARNTDAWQDQSQPGGQPLVQQAIDILRVGAIDLLDQRHEIDNCSAGWFIPEGFN